MGAEFSNFETFRLENRWGGGGRERNQKVKNGRQKLNYLLPYPPLTKN